MPHIASIASLCLALACAAFALSAHADPKTVCSITVNSSDEKEAFRKRLPPGHRFVELVEKGRADWLGAACEKAVQCDVLVVSGHFNAGEYFYSDRLESTEHLRIDELERASCSESCPGLFSRLKEVYLFGCESLNPDASTYASSHGDSGRDRMRRIFANVPVIYGFAGSAPVGATAGTLLHRYFDSGASDLGTGRPSARLLAIFSRNGMTTTRGERVSAGAAAGRNPICQFFDERVSPAQKIAFVHGVMRRDMGEAVGFLERIEALLGSLTDAERAEPAFLQSLAVISADDASRAKFLAAQHATDDPRRRARMIALATTLGWLAPQARRTELLGLVTDILARRTIGVAEVGLACELNVDGELTGGLPVAPTRAGQAGRLAVLACLGDPEARTQVIASLAGTYDRDVQMAQAYLRQRPVTDRHELRALALAIARMPGTGAQIRALDTLGRLDIDDREITAILMRSFAETRSADVQRAIAEVILRSGIGSMKEPGLLGVLRRHQIKSSGAADLVDELIGRVRAVS